MQIRTESDFFIPKWDLFGLKIAREAAGLSKDPSTKVGAYICDPKHREVSMGFNGFPADLLDCPAYYEDRDYKIPRIIHAELNAILFAERDKLKGATLYTYPFSPCLHCSSIIIQAGIKRVVSIETTNERWLPSIEAASRQFYDAEVEYITYSALSFLKSIAGV